ncbi:MAG TPA: beta-propeller fold lactonase family protein [Bacilli bacterium]|nr:beta-propeller fold lactonase family protein [Bacilli bacterium]
MKKLAYVTNTDSNDISVIDVAEQKELGRIPIGGSPRGCMIIDPKGNYGYVSNCAGNSVSVVDLLEDKEVTRIVVGLAPRGVAMTPDSKYLFVSNSGSDDVSIIDLERRQEVSRIEVGSNPRALSITPNGKYACIPLWGDDAVAIIEIKDDIMTSKVVSRISLGQDAKPYHACVDWDNEHLYTANTHRHTLSVINLNDLALIKEVPIGFGPRGVLPDPADHYVYVSCEASNAVSVVDKNMWKEEKQIAVGPTPRGMKIDEVERTLYVTAFARTIEAPHLEKANALSVIDLNVKEAVGVIKTGLGPCSVNIYDPALFGKVESENKEVSVNG